MTMDFHMNNLTPQITSTFDALKDTYAFLQYLGVNTTKMTFNLSARFLFKHLKIWAQPNRHLEFFIVDQQKQPLEVFYKKGCFLKCCKIQRKTPVSESLF